MPECDGACDTRFGAHKGEVRRVHVWQGARDFGEFNYCEQAIEDDREHGFTVEEVRSDVH